MIGILKNRFFPYLFKEDVRNNIIHALFWGIIFGFLLPYWGNYIIKGYDNRAALNRLILSHGFSPYQAQKLIFEKQNTELLQYEGQSFEDWQIIKTQMGKIGVGFDPSLATQEDENKVMYFLKDSVQADKNVRASQSLLQFSTSKLINDETNLALLLGVTPQFNQLKNNLNQKLNEINKKYITKNNDLLKKIGLSPLDDVSNVDIYNDYLTSTFDDLVKRLKMDPNALVHLTTQINIDRRQNNLYYFTETFIEWKNFNTKINTLFLESYQKKLKT